MSIDLGPIDGFPEGCPVLRKAEDGHRFACVRLGEAVHAIDDRCPHQGYPLSQGSVRGGVLTCEWHNWKFDLGTGACTFGGEPVRRYPTQVVDGRVHLTRSMDRGAEARRITTSFREALVRDDAPRALRESIRLGALGIGPSTSLGPLGVGFELLALDGAERAEYGFDHGLAVLADLASWTERGWVGAEEAFVQAARAVAEPSRNLGSRTAATRGSSGAANAANLRASLARLADLDGVENDQGVDGRVTDALTHERREEAEAIVRALVEAGGPDAGYAALMPFAATHIHDYGHGAIFLAKALELAHRFPPAAVELLASTTAMLAWATADTSLPPFAATREALATLATFGTSGTVGARRGFGDGPVGDARGFESLVLKGEREALAATLAAFDAGASPLAVLRRVAHAAAVRLRRFDGAWERRLDAEVSVLDVTHAVTYAEACIALASRAGADVRLSARLAVLAAGFVGKLRRADAADLLAPHATPGRGSLADALEARDVGAALAAVDGRDRAARLAVYQEIAPFAALDACVRPIFYAHTVKTTEALRRLDEADPEGDAAYLEANLAFLAPRRPEGRGRRTAAVARRFMQDGRPPEGLY